MQTTCRHCGNPVYDEDWLRCPFCGEQLDVSAGFVSGMTRGAFRYVGVVIALVLIYILLSFVL